MAAKTKSLLGKEEKITGLGGVYASVYNGGSNSIYASCNPNITAGADGVIPIPAGGSIIVPDCNGTVYLLGTGTVTAIGTTEPVNFFKSAAGGSSSGGSGDGVNQEYVDTQDAATLTAANDYTDSQVSTLGNNISSVQEDLLEHIDNTEIHLTAEQAQAAAAQVCSNPNLLINSDFSVNQRGLSEYTSGYCVDCWRIIVPDVKISILPRGIKIGYGTDTTPPAAIKQTIERYQALAGKTITASVYLSEKNSERANLSINYLINGTRQYKTKWLNEGNNTFTVSIPDDIEDLQFWIYGADVRTGVDTTDSYSVVEWAKLEIGSAATPFSPSDPATELAKCQRYYQICSAGDIPAVDIRPIMRITPTVIQLSDGNYSYSADF